MLTQQNYIKILSYLDNQLTEMKPTDTNHVYRGLVLDFYFDNSVLSIDYLDIADYFDHNGSFGYVDNSSLVQQFGDLETDKCLKLLENVLTLLHRSTVKKDESNHIIKQITTVLKRDNVKVINRDDISPITVTADDIFDSGSYCNIMRVKKGILRKELNTIYQDNEISKKRMRYEFENMQKLHDCPQVLNVYEYNPENNSYLMEQCDTNLYDYLANEIDLSFDERLKIIMDIVKGIAFAHQQKIIHRDLHLGNILKLGNDFLIADFGLSKDLSIEHSMKSSITAKNNHLFVDPLAGSDFTKLDQKSDVYSIGKIIDYVFTYNAQDTNHMFKTVVERCISRTKELRYEEATNILNEIENIVKKKNQVQNRDEIIYNICGNRYDSQVHDFIMKLTETERISQFIVEYSLNLFWTIILQFESVYQAEILQTILSTYVKATGNGGWTNYDIFAQISYKLCLNAEDFEVKNLARGILEGCASVRYEARDLLARLPD